jgi:hypothetical protein
MQERVRATSPVLALLLACGSGTTPSESPDATTGVDAAADGSGAEMTDASSGEEGSVSPPPDAAAEAGTGCGAHCGDVLTWHNDNARTGQNLYETTLTPSNVNAAGFGKLFVLPVDGYVDAQPLYVSAVNVAGKGQHDVVFVATEHDSVYAFDAESNTGQNATPLWQVSLLGTGETTSDTSAAGRACGQVKPEIGVTSTPVVDPASGTMFAVAMSKNAGGYIQRLHAIDITSGAERTGSPVEIQASLPGSGSDSDGGGSIAFLPKQYKERAALLLNGGALYLTWSSHCDILPYNGWVMAYDPSTLRQTAVLDVTPNGVEGSIWGAGAGPAADSNGNIYFLDANGTFDTTLDSNGFPANRDFGNAMLRISTAGGSLSVADYFATFDTGAQSGSDLDFGSGGAMLLPDEVGSAAHPHLIVGAGKDGNMYVVDRDNMGKWNGVDGGTDNSQIVQELEGALPGQIFSSPAYFNHAIYYGDVGGQLKRFAIDGASVSTPPTSLSATGFPSPGTTPSISVNGSAADPASTAIVWAMESPSGGSTVLHAYSARDLTQELYDGNQAPGGRDALPQSGNKFMVPTVSHGHVYMGSQTGVAVFGLLERADAEADAP